MHTDPMSHTAEDFAIAKAAMTDGSERNRRYMRRRVAAVLWIPGMLLILYIAGVLHSGAVALSEVIALVIALVVYATRSDRP